MAGSVNVVMLLGNVGKDPEIRTLNGGDRVANFSIATSESWTDKQSGEKKEKTEWHNVVVFNDGLVGVIERYVTKGSKVHVSGSLQTRKWQDKDGNDKYSTEVVLSKFRGELTLCGDGGGGDRGRDDRDGGRSRSNDRDDRSRGGNDRGGSRGGGGGGYDDRSK